MYRSTRPLRRGVRPSLSSSSVPVLPRRSVQETVWSGIQGLWSLVVSEDKRQAYLDLAHPGWNRSSSSSPQQQKQQEEDGQQQQQQQRQSKQPPINYPILAQARMGSLLTTGLFHEMQNPLWKQTNYEPVEFLQGVAPALEKFHAALGDLQNDFPNVQTYQEQQDLLGKLVMEVRTNTVAASTTPPRSLPEEDEEEDQDDEKRNNHRSSSSPLAAFDAWVFSHANPWVDKAREQPKSSAANLCRMVVPSVLDMIFLTTKLSSVMFRCVEGTTRVEHAALLSVKAVNMDEEDEDDDDTFNGDQDFYTEKDEDSIVPKNVVAQVEVLYTVEQKREFKTEVLDRMDPTTTNDETSVVVSEQQKEFVKAVREELDRTKTGGGGTTQKPPPDVQEFVYIGTFEAWLKGGPKPEGLRWRITDLRSPEEEFPDIRPTTSSSSSSF